MHTFEIQASPYEENKSAIALWEHIAKRILSTSNSIPSETKKIMSLSIRLKDSLHIACDIESKCDDFIATDKDLLNKTAANIITIDPTNFVRKMEDRTDPHLIIQSDKKLWTNLSIDEIHNTATERGDSR